MTYTIMCRLDDDAFAMMRRARFFCEGDDKARTHGPEIRDKNRNEMGVEIWTVETSINIDERLEQAPFVLEYERPPLPEHTHPY